MNKELMQSYYETYNSEDPDKLRLFYSDDVVLSSSQGEQHGPDAILETYRYLINNFHDKMTPSNIEINGNIAIVEIADKFTAKKDVADFLGTSFKIGQSFEINIRGTYEAVDGKFKKITIEMV